jgi:hypothetical protein
MRVRRVILPFHNQRDRDRSVDRVILALLLPLLLLLLLMEMIMETSNSSLSTTAAAAEVAVAFHPSIPPGQRIDEKRMWKWIAKQQQQQKKAAEAVDTPARVPHRRLQGGMVGRSTDCRRSD